MLGKLQATLTDVVLAERARWLLWVPVLVGCGIFLYFAADTEPKSQTGVLVTVMALLGCFGWRKHPVKRAVLMAIAAVALGFSAAKWQQLRVDTPTLTREQPYRQVEGRLDDVITTPNGLKLVIANPKIERLPETAWPKKIRLSLRKGDKRLQIGQQVRLRAGLFPLPEPAYPGGYDFSRHFYFQSIGAVGYGIAPVEILADAPESGWQENAKQLRADLTRRFQTGIGGAEGAIAAALVTGDQAAIPESVQEVMRISGLAHILSISGLHLTLVAGTLFLWIRYILVLIPGLALRYPVKKWAAGLAALGTFAYLALADYPVPAQRAFLMVALVMGAILFDRRVMPMRSLAIAATLILLWTPESLLGPSFQLSFAATLCIVALYESTRIRSDLPWRRERWGARSLTYVAGIILTSLVAGLATTPFVIYHFNQATAYTLLANLIVSPIVSFLIMPCAILSVFLMPVGFDGWAMQGLKLGIGWMIDVAEWVATLPYADTYVASPPVWGLAATAVGLLWLCFWLGRWRWFGLIGIAAGALSMAFVRQPDLLVAEKAAQIAIRQTNGYAVPIGSRRNFTAGLWQEMLGVETWAPLNMACDDYGCLSEHDGVRIALPFYPESAVEDCLSSDLIATPFYFRCRGVRMLMRPEDATAVYIDNGEVQFVYARSFIDRLRADEKPPSRRDRQRHSAGDGESDYRRP